MSNVGGGVVHAWQRPTTHLRQESHVLNVCVLVCACCTSRYLPAIRGGEWWRLFSSICLHGSFAHLFSNMLVFVVLAVPLEHR